MLSSHSMLKISHAVPLNNWANTKRNMAEWLSNWLLFHCALHVWLWILFSTTDFGSFFYFYIFKAPSFLLFSPPIKKVWGGRKKSGALCCVCEGQWIFRNCSQPVFLSLWLSYDTAERLTCDWRTSSSHPRWKAGSCGCCVQKRDALAAHLCQHKHRLKLCRTLDTVELLSGLQPGVPSAPSRDIWMMREDQWDTQFQSFRCTCL